FDRRCFQCVSIRLWRGVCRLRGFCEFHVHEPGWPVAVRIRRAGLSHLDARSHGRRLALHHRLSACGPELVGNCRRAFGLATDEATKGEFKDWWRVLAI